MGRVHLLLFVAMGLFVVGCGGEDGATSYEQEVMQTRVQRDMKMREKESVLPPDRRNSFRGLDFYEVDPAYRFTVELERFSPPDTVMIAESTGGLRSQVQVGEVSVPLPSRTVDLVVFRGEGDDPRGRLWIPFADSTNGRTTYGAGRYVDLKEVEGDSVVVDFNRTYNPTCAYNPDYSCPLPPRENRLEVAIPAGEKKPIFRNGSASGE